MNYLEQTKNKIIELEKSIAADQEKTQKESLKYYEIIQNYEEEKHDLENILEEEMRQCNELSVNLFNKLGKLLFYIIKIGNSC